MPQGNHSPLPIDATLGRELMVAGLRADHARSYGGITTIHVAQQAVGRLRSLTEQATEQATERAVSSASVVLDLFIDKRRVPLNDVRRGLESVTPSLFTRLSNSGLLASDGQTVWAPRAILPVAQRLICAPWAMLPDDSSLHLLGCLPRMSATHRWLDIGTGTGLLPLIGARGTTTATDVSTSCLAAAVIGEALSGIRKSIQWCHADLFEDLDPRSYDLITFNAPIENHASLLTRFWHQAPRFLAPGGEILVHSVISPSPAGPTPKQAPPHAFTSTIIYSPPEFTPAFGVTLHRPDGPSRKSYFSYRQLTVRAPHLTRADLQIPD